MKKKGCTQRTPTTSALASGVKFSVKEGFSRHIPVQNIDSGERQRSMGDPVFPYHDSFSIFVEIESDVFDLVVIDDTGAKLKAPLDGVSGDANTWSIEVRFHEIASRDRRVACDTNRRDTSIPIR